MNVRWRERRATRRTGSDAEHSDRAGLDLRAACVVHQVVEEAERARLRLELTPAHVKGTRSASEVGKWCGALVDGNGGECERECVEINQ